MMFITCGCRVPGSWDDLGLCALINVPVVARPAHGLGILIVWCDGPSHKCAPPFVAVLHNPHWFDDLPWVVITGRVCYIATLIS